ncbi:MAG: efflux RND transporter permease subunit [Magnetovibrionaceae bacterium]
MNTLIAAAVSHSRTVLSALLLVLIAGSVAYVSIPKEADPDVNIPIIYVSLSLEGISPEDSERLLVRPMETELRVIEGVKEMRSTAYEGGGNVVLEFDAGFDADQALTDVREKVDLAKPELPEEADEPTVNEVNFSLFPIIVVTLSGDVPERTLLRLAERLEDEIEGISSVLKVDIAGDREELLEVLVDPSKIESYGLTFADVLRIVDSSNQLVAAGFQDTGAGRFSMKVPGLFETLDDVATLPLKVEGDAVVMLRDIAEVRRTFKDAEGFARVGGEPAIALEVVKRTGENVIETIEAVRHTVERARAGWDAGLTQAVHVAYSQDKSTDIRTMLTDLQNNVIAAVLLVMIVVLAALGSRSAGLVGVAIPGSFLTGVLVIATLGLTINIVVLFALILAVGMLVDGAIVVTEYADRKMSEGEHRKRAYRLAAQRMAWPITASTATTLAAFMPLMFWPGVVGEFMKYLPLTLIATLAASLLMALIFVPTLGAQVGKAGSADPRTMRALAAGATGDLHDIHGPTGIYLRILETALRHPVKVLLTAATLLVGVQVVYANFGKGVEFFPEVEPTFAMLQVRARGNLSALEKDGLMKEVEDRVLDIKAFKTIYTRTGRGDQSEEAEDIIGTINLEFVDWQERPKASVIMAEVNERVSDLAGIEVDFREQEQGPPVGKPVQVQLSSRLPDLLDPAIAVVRAKFDAMPGLTNVEDSRPLPGIDWELSVDRAQAAKFGVDVALVGSAIQMVTNGLKLGEYRPDDADEEIDIRARHPVDYRTLQQLDRIRIETAEGSIPISTFVTREPKPRVGQLNRVDGHRVMSVKADVAEGILPDSQVQALQEWLATGVLDPRIDVEFKGEDEEQRAAQDFLGKAFGVALFIMAIILVTQFNSFYSAGLILTAVIMSTIGVFIGLLITGQPFGIVMGGIGVIALAGIVVNNNIVLIDTFDRLAKDTASEREAILRTGVQRFRPVLLTTITTILGLLPMVLGVNIDFVERVVTVGAPAMQWWSQLATAIVFGLGFATLLTLVVTPSALMARANFRHWRSNRRTRSERVEGVPAE